LARRELCLRGDLGGSVGERSGEAVGEVGG